MFVTEIFSPLPTNTDLVESAYQLTVAFNTNGTDKSTESPKHTGLLLVGGGGGPEGVDIKLTKIR